MLTRKDVAQVIDQALREDAPWGDITSNYLIDAEATAHASLVARESGIWSGGAVIEQTFLATDENSKIVLSLRDGERFEVGTVIAEIWSNARALLRAERVALNLTQRMSGIATLTWLYVEQTLGTVEGAVAEVADFAHHIGGHLRHGQVLSAIDINSGGQGAGASRHQHSQQGQHKPAHG